MVMIAVSRSLSRYRYHNKTRNAAPTAGTAFHSMRLAPTRCAGATIPTFSLCLLSVSDSPALKRGVALPLSSPRSLRSAYHPISTHRPRHGTLAFLRYFGLRFRFDHELTVLPRIGRNISSKGRGFASPMVAGCPPVHGATGAGARCAWRRIKSNTPALQARFRLPAHAGGGNRHR